MYVWYHKSSGFTTKIASCASILILWIHVLDMITMSLFKQDVVKYSIYKYIRMVAEINVLVLKLSKELKLIVILLLWFLLHCKSC